MRGAAQTVILPFAIGDTPSSTGQAGARSRNPGDDKQALAG